MIGELPKTIKVGEKEEPIRTDFRDILNVFAAFNDQDLSVEEKAIVCLRIIYKNIDEMDSSLYMEAYEKAMNFMEMNDSKKDSDYNEPKLMDWEQDEQLIFSLISSKYFA